MFVLTFQIGQERWALDVRRILEVVPRVHLQSAVGGSSSITGLFVYRGKPVPVVDLYRHFGRGDCPYFLSSRIILVPCSNTGGGASIIGFLAAEVADIEEISTAELQSAEVRNDHVGNRTTTLARGTKLLRILDMDVLLASVGMKSPQVAVP